MLLFTSGVTRRAAQLEGNAERLAGGLPLLPASPGRDGRQAQAMLEHIVAWSPMVMFRGLLGGRGEAFVSGNVERILGYTSGQVLATPRFWFDRLHPQDRDRFTETLQRAVAERAPQL